MREREELRRSAHRNIDAGVVHMVLKVCGRIFPDFYVLSGKKMQNDQLRVTMGNSCWRFEKREDDIK